MQDKLLSEFPAVSYEQWRAQVEKDLKGADFEKRLLTRTLEGITVQPLYTGGEDASASDPGGFAGLSPYRRGPRSVGSHGEHWDICAEQTAPDTRAAAQEIADDLGAGATSLWLRFDACARTGSADRTLADGLPCDTLAQLDAALAQVDLAKTRVALDGGGNVAPAAMFLALAERKDADPTTLHGTLGYDPLGGLARDGSLPFDLARARQLFVELSRMTASRYPRLRAAVVDIEPYQLAGANAVQELAYALGTGLEYLRWCLDGEGGLALEPACSQIAFRVPVASDLFMEIAKLRALRLCWAKLVAAHGGSPSAQNTHVHAVSALRTKTRNDPWVNMLRTTTEGFAAMVGGADSVTTRGFDVALGRSDEFARRIARNAQIILNEEAHVTQVADAAGGSYYVESLTDQLARAAWAQLQELERLGGMAVALESGAVAKAIEASARARAQGVAKRSAPLTGVSEFANLSEEPVKREALAPRAAADQPLPGETAQQAVEQLRAAPAEGRFIAALNAARQGAALGDISRALGAGCTPLRRAPLPVRRPAAAFEALRDRVQRHIAAGGAAPKAFLCNLGEIPKHKARASFSAGFLHAGGIDAIDNDGFASAQEALAAYAAADTSSVVICGSDEQYSEWVASLAPELRARGARQIIVAGKPGDQQASYEQAGVTDFIFMGTDVVAALKKLLDGMGVAS